MGETTYNVEIRTIVGYDIHTLKGDVSALVNFPVGTELIKFRDTEGVNCIYRAEHIVFVKWQVLEESE